VIGTNEIGTSLFIDGPVQIQAEEQWLQDNRSWSCNSSTIHRSGKIVGCRNLSCAFDRQEPRTLAGPHRRLRERDRAGARLTASLMEKQGLIEQQNTVLELVDTGIILIDRQGVILKTNRMAMDILHIDSDIVGSLVSKTIPVIIYFRALMARSTP
jgi:transcriptional regulator of acetoin/glycerol metabolism